ncbi:MAG: TVP38/TMEM64 family protein [Shimia sp.]
MRGFTKAICIAGLAVAFGGAWIWLEQDPRRIGALLTQDGIAGIVATAGPWGPAVLIGLMAAAIVASPIPSAPIALVAGAAYGHVWGTAIIVAGAQVGAMSAFGLARWLGRDVLERRFGLRLSRGLMGSQRMLAWGVFVSRLLPFVSFDLVSYAAGLTKIGTGLFFVATLAGIVPASFLLAHFGGELAEGSPGGIALGVLGLGLLTGAPLIWKVLRGHRARKDASAPAAMERDWRAH